MSKGADVTGREGEYILNVGIGLSIRYGNVLATVETVAVLVQDALIEVSLVATAVQRKGFVLLALDTARRRFAVPIRGRQ